MRRLDTRRVRRDGRRERRDDYRMDKRVSLKNLCVLCARLCELCEYLGLTHAYLRPIFLAFTRKYPFIINGVLCGLKPLPLFRYARSENRLQPMLLVISDRIMHEINHQSVFNFAGTKINLMPDTPTYFEIKNKDGYVECEFYKADSDKAVIYMHGVGGGTHGPSNIYHPLAEDLLKSGISSLLIDCRYDSDLDECISDVLACIEYLDKNFHIGKIGLIGWSFGGAVVLSATAADRRVKTVVTVASQSYGAKDVSQIAPRPILIIHGTGDKTLTYECSVDISDRARQPKKLVLFPGADHGISQNKKEMYELVREWFLENL